jgi:hypothetical protein
MIKMTHIHTTTARRGMTAGPQNCKDFELTPGIHATNKILEFVS